MSQDEQSVGQVEGNRDGLCEACRAGNVRMPMGTVVSPEDAAEFDRAAELAAEAEAAGDDPETAAT